MRLHWNDRNTPAVICNILQQLSGSAEGPVRELEFIPLDQEPEKLRVSRRDDVFTVSYGKNVLAARGIACALAGLECDEQCAFSRFGVLTDWTTGRVPQLASLKKQFLDFALLGFGKVVIHLADNIYFPEEPSIGKKQGHFSGKGLQELRTFAEKIGLELEFSLDTALLSSSALEKTFALLAEQLQVSSVYIDPGTAGDISGNIASAAVKRRLARVLELSRKYTVTPIFWSDTPRGIDTGKELFSAIQREDAPVTECKRASAGIPSDCGFWTSAERTEVLLSARLQACRKAETEEVILTLRNPLSVPESDLAVLAWCADQVFNVNPSADRTGALFSAVSGMDYALVRKTGKLSCSTLLPGGRLPMDLLLNDSPLSGEFRKMFAQPDPAELKQLLALCRELMEQTDSLREECSAWNLAWNICGGLAAVLELRLTLGRAYSKHDFQLLNTVSGRYIPDLLDALEGIEESFRSVWLGMNQPFGTEKFRTPLAVLASEYSELGRWIDEFMEGDRDAIPFLEEENL